MLPEREKKDGRRRDRTIHD